MQRAVFLDRDGVLNQAIVRNGRPYAPMSLAEFTILPGVREALEALARERFLLIVVTNQPDVGRGKQTRAVVDEMHARLSAHLPVDEIMACFDGDEATSTWYKPKPGMLLDAAARRGIDLSASYMVGDRWRDVGCGIAAGCYTVFIDRGYEENLVDNPHARCRDLPEAAGIILRHARGEHEAQTL